MATGTYAPDPDLHIVDANGVPVPGGLVWTYIAGTLTPTPTYTDVGLLVPNTNPIVAGSDGRFVAFLTGGVSYKFVYEMPAVPPAHGATIATRDNILAVTTIVPGSGGGVTQNTILTGTVNDFPLIPGCTILYCNNAAPLTITGFSGGVTGQRLTVMATSSSLLTLAYMSASSLAANRLLNFLYTISTPIIGANSYGSVTYIYSGVRWEMIAHEQGGGWLPIPYSAANFTGNGAMTWTVDAGDVTTLRYRLQGNSVQLAFAFYSTTVGGTLNTTLAVTLPFAATAFVAGLIFVIDGGGTGVTGVAQITAGSAQLTFQKLTGNWAASTNQTYIYGQMTFEVS